MASSAKDLIRTLMKLKNLKRAKSSAPYVGIKPGFYGDGDKLLGVPMPSIRSIIKESQASLPLKEIGILLNSEFHEIRMSGVLILLYQYKKTSRKIEKTKFYNFFIKNIEKNNINNWDFVDIAAPNLTGNYLFETPDKGRNILLKFSKSANLWFRRVSVISTFYHIKQGDYKITFDLAVNLMKDEHHLIHKAIGWMLREIGKQNEELLLEFLHEHHESMPRVMLRYSIEKLSPDIRRGFLKKI